MSENQLGRSLEAFCRLSGEDTRIIFDPETDPEVAGQFAAIGLLVLTIFCISIYSSIHFLLNMLIGSHLFAFAVGLLWGAIIANIYYLLLFTITPPILKGREWNVHGVRKEATTEKKLLARVSLSFRLLFVILLAVIIAQPWLVTIFDTSKWIDVLRREYRSEFVRLADSGFLGVDSLHTENRAAGNRREIDLLLTRNNFYTRRIQLINARYRLSWLVTSISVLFFIMPIALKYRVRNNSNFYQVKKKREENWVKNSYEQFKEDYSAVFTDRFGIAAEWYESYVDPPFNTQKRIEQQTNVDQQQLLDKIYEQDSDEQKKLIRETIS